MSGTLFFSWLRICSHPFFTPQSRGKFTVKRRTWIINFCHINNYSYLCILQFYVANYLTFYI